MRTLPLVLALVLALWSPSALAHDARSSSVDVEVTGSVVTVHLAATQAGLHHALEAAAGHALDAQGDGYRALVADHLRRTLRLSADGAPLAVGDIGLRLGDHQSDARFVAGLPDVARALDLSVESFDGVEGQQTIVRVRHDGETTRAVLSEADGQTLSVPLARFATPAARGEASGASRSGWAVGLGLTGLALTLMLLLIACPLLLVALRRSPVPA